ncbi:hypothetical protein KSS87_001118 [Heliosperma pusillum]|nr:hypothetical protein KSS87_001118 [Heliosperma pusillum]
MALRSFLILLLVFLLSCSHLLSLNAIPLSRGLNMLPSNRGEILVSESMNENEKMNVQDMIEEDIIEGRMDIEKNDYGPPTSNPVHTPKPPRT